MSFEEEFDKIIRQKAEDAEFPFDEKNWEQASAMIAADKKAARIVAFKKLLKPALAFTTLLSAVVISITFFGTEKTHNQLAQSTNVANTNPNQNSNTTAKVNSNVQPEVSDAKLVTISQNNSDVSSNNNSTHKNEVNTEEQSNPEQNYAFTAQKNTAKNQTEEPVQTPEINNIESPVPASEAIVSDLQPNVTETPSQQKAETNDAASKVLDKDENANLAVLPLVDQLNAFSLNLPYTPEEKALANENRITILNYDDAYFKAKPKTHYLNVEAGLAYLTGWNTTSEKDGKGLNYFGGINYGFYLTQKLSIGLGVQAYNLANMNQPFYTSAHKEYDFGSTTIYTVVTCSQLYYAAIPLKLNYFVNKSNQFGIGFNAAFAFDSFSTRESYYYQDNAKIITSSSTEKGLYDGINAYNFMLTANYTYRFSKRFSLNAEAVYGLSDLFKNTVETNATQKTNGIRFSLNYTIFDK